MSHTQAIALAAEVGRENGYRKDILFGGHIDPAGKGIQNSGMLSWNGNRRIALLNHLRNRGLLVGGGSIQQSQTAIDAQAAFAVAEMKGSYRNKLTHFWNNPNAHPDAFAREVGKNYIVWAYGQNAIRDGNGGRKAFNWRNQDNVRRDYMNQIIAMSGGGIPTYPITGTDGINTSDYSTDGIDGAGGSSSTSASSMPSAETMLARSLFAKYSNSMLDIQNSATSSMFEKNTNSSINIENFKMNGFGEAVGSSITGAITNSTVGGAGHPKAMQAADIATSRAGAKSTGQCGKYVRIALQSAGVPYTAVNHAYQAHSLGNLKNAGFQLIQDTGQYVKGDVMVFDPIAPGESGHIQIFNGSRWISDFKQNTMVSSKYRDKPRHLYRMPGGGVIATPPQSAIKKAVNGNSVSEKGDYLGNTINKVTKLPSTSKNSLSIKPIMKPETGANTVLAPKVTASNNNYNLTPNTTRLVESTTSKKDHSQESELQKQTMLLAQIADATKATSLKDPVIVEQSKGDNFFVNGNYGSNMTAAQKQEVTNIVNTSNRNGDRFPDYMMPSDGALRVAGAGVA